MLTDYCPPLFDSCQSQEIWKQVKGAVSVNELLKGKAKAGEYIFYRTDHHWTSYGAYLAYKELGKELGYTPYELSDFRAEELSTSFYGTTYSASLFPFTLPDTLSAYRYDGDEKLKVSDMITKKELHLYDYSALAKTSKYDFFLGGNRALTKIEGGKPMLIVIKDSFANSLIPFLTKHFDMVIIDPRYLREPIETTLERLFSEHEPTSLVFIFGIDTLATGRIFPNSLDKS